MWFTISRSIRKKLALIVNEEGIFDQTTFLSIGQIEWKEIAAIEDRQWKGIAILVKEPAYFLHQVSNPLKKLFMRLNWKLDSSPIHLNTMFIEISQKDLLKELKMRQNKSASLDDFSEHLVDDNG